MTEESSPPSFAALVAAVEERRHTVTVHAPAIPDALVSLFDTRHVAVDHEFLPAGAAEPFLTVTAGDRYVGSVDLPALSDFAHPSIHDVGSPDLVEAAYRRLTSLLPDTVFSSLDRRQLLATSREIEDRAWRVGTGRLDAGFQRLSNLRAQTDVYTALCDRGLEVHLYGHPDGSDRPTVPGATFHADGAELGQVWFMAYDGGRTPGQACGLVAVEADPGTFEGFWTYDPDVVARIFDAASRFPPTDDGGHTPRDGAAADVTETDDGRGSDGRHDREDGRERGNENENENESANRNENEDGGDPANGNESGNESELP